MRLDESFKNQCFTFNKVLCASSYGHFIARKEFWSQCHILRFCNTFEIRICNPMIIIIIISAPMIRIIIIIIIIISAGGEKDEL